MGLISILSVTQGFFLNQRAKPAFVFRPVVFSQSKHIKALNAHISQTWHPAANFTEAKRARLSLNIVHGERFSTAAADGRNLTVALRFTEEMSDPSQAFQGPFEVQVCCLYAGDATHQR